MASFRSGIKIISDVTKRQGKALLQRSISAEHLLAFRGKRFEALSRSVSPVLRRNTEEPQQTELATKDKSWFSRFNDRQGRSFIVEDKPRLLSPVKGLQQPNRYFSAYCPKMPKPIEKENTEKDEGSSVICGKDFTTLSTFCEDRPIIPTYTACPKPVNLAGFRCPGPRVPKKRPYRKKIYRPKCVGKKVSTFKVCPKPPSRDTGNKCLLKKRREKEKKERESIPIRTPRRCVCKDETLFIESEEKPPLYKMNPDIPFRVCPKKKGMTGETFKWSSSSKVCVGASKGACAQQKCDETTKGTKGSKSCKKLKGDICETDPCPSKSSKPSGVASGSGTSTGKRKPSKSQKSDEFPKRSKISKISSNEKSNTKATCTKRPSKTCVKKPAHKKHKKPGSICPKIRFPGCRVAKSISCVKKPGKRAKCKKVPVPTRCFSECYKGPCPPKVCSPCPCVRMLTLTECDVKEKITHLQPKKPIFKIKPPFKIPPPPVELFIDPSIQACCESMRIPPPKPSGPPPCGISKVTRKPSKVQKSKPKPKPESDSPRKGCDCKMFNFVRTLMSYLKGEEKTCPEPTEDIQNVVKELEKAPSKAPSKQSSKMIACQMDPDATARKPTRRMMSSKKEKEEKKSKNKKNLKKEKKEKKAGDNKLCPKHKLSGCREPYRDTCLIVKTHKPCTRKPPPRPSFSECLKEPFPNIKNTECRIAMKRVKSLSELNDKGLRVTPENLHAHYSMCLKPHTKGCELMSKPIEFLKTSHSCLMMPCSAGQEG